MGPFEASANTSEMFAVFTRNFVFDFGDFIRGQLAHGRGDRVFAQWQRAALPVVSRQAVIDYRPRYGTYYRPHGYYSHRWVRGERLPVAFYGRPYVIADYRGWGLYGPPRGYHWVRVDGDAVLAAIATGIVLDTVFDAFH